MKKFLLCFVYAARGVWHCLRCERNFRFHLTAAAYVLALATRFPLTRAEWAALLLVIGLVLSAEAVNTAVEQAVNLASPHRNNRARVAKDVAAGAVLLCAVTAVSIGTVLFWHPSVWSAIISDLETHPWKVLVLLLSIPPAVLFIVCGGRRGKPLPSRDTNSSDE